MFRDKIKFDIFRSGHGLNLGVKFRKNLDQQWISEQFSDFGGRDRGVLLPFFSGRQMVYVFACLGLIFFILSCRVIYLQIFKGRALFALAGENSTKEMYLQASRGIIFDRRGEPLVRNIPTFTLELNQNELSKERDKQKDSITELARVLQVHPNDILDQLNRFKNFSAAPVPLKFNLTHEEAVRLGAEIKNIEGAEIRVDTRREYLLSYGTKSLSHLLGYLGQVEVKDLDGAAHYAPHDLIGKAGIEASYESLLRGKLGKKIIEVDALRREKAILEFTESKGGENLTLTIDSKFQAFTEKVLARQLAVSGKKRGAAIVLNPKNGDLLALVSLPAYDNNLFANGISREEYRALVENKNHPLFPRAIAGEYPSGSTIKPFIALAALAEKIITPATVINSTGGIWYDRRWFFPDWKVGGHGRVNVYEAIAESVNTFFYVIGGGYGETQGLGVHGISNYLRKFGFGAALSIELGGEASGLVPDEDWKLSARRENWYIGDTYHLAIGQGDILVTPLQLAAATSAIANNGALIKPHLLLGNEIMIHDFGELSEEIKVVRDAMRRTITFGSAKSLSDMPWEIAGKTGTAEWKRGAPAHAWFSSFAPASNPELVVVILIEEGGEGSRVAVPVAGEIYNYYFTHVRNSDTNKQ